MSSMFNDDSIEETLSRCVDWMRMCKCGHARGEHVHGHTRKTYCEQCACERFEEQQP